MSFSQNSFGQPMSSFSQNSFRQNSFKPKMSKPTPISLCEVSIIGVDEKKDEIKETCGFSDGLMNCLVENFKYSSFCLDTCELNGDAMKEEFNETCSTVDESYAQVQHSTQPLCGDDSTSSCWTQDQVNEYCSFTEAQVDCMFSTETEPNQLDINEQTDGTYTCTFVDEDSYEYKSTCTDSTDTCTCTCTI